MHNRSSQLFRAARLMVMVAALVVIGAGWLWAEPPRNVILLIGDGMGPEQIKAASLYVGGKEGSLFIESLPRKAEVVTCPAYTVPPPGSGAAAPVPAAAKAKGPAAAAKPKATGTAAAAGEAGAFVPSPKVTDSAAAATAMATGQKVYNGVLSVALPGDGKPLPTVLERFASEGKGTGLVTTSFLTDATPAAFAAHADARSQQKDIAAEMLRQRPNVLLGGGAKGIPLADDAKAAGYEVVTDRAGLHAVKAAAGGHTLGLFGVGPMCYEYAYLSKTKKDYDQIPHLSEMAMEALRLLSAEPKGFFLMIEGGCIDKACHSNDLPGAIHETIEFDKTVRLVAEWAAKRGDTLLLVTADHETGGLKVVAGKGRGQLPQVTWESKKHSGANVLLLAPSSGPAAVKGTLDNTDVFRLMTGTFVSPTVYKPPVGVIPPPDPAAAAKDN